jgi:hypothetical protein
LRIRARVLPRGLARALARRPGGVAHLSEAHASAQQHRACQNDNPFATSSRKIHGLLLIFVGCPVANRGDLDSRRFDRTQNRLPG